MTRAPELTAVNCTSCGAGDVEVIEGKELFIDTLEGD